MSNMRTTISICIGLALVAALTGAAGATPAGDCASAKRRATGKRVQSALNCWSLSAKKQKPVDPLCLARAEAKFLIAFARAERGEGCLTVGDTDAIGAAIDAYVASVVAALPDSGAPVPTATGGPPTSTQGGPSSTPTPTPTATRTPLPCTNVLGYCWHLGNSDESCNETCSRVGSAYNVATEDVAGSGGPYASCQAVMNALGFSGSGLGSAACTSLPGVGCAGGDLNGSLDYLQCALPTTTADSAQAGLQRACACGSGPTPTPTPTPFSCPAGGVWVDGACWSLGDAGAGCNATCTDLGLAYDTATASHAGSGGGYEDCQAVANALGFAGSGAGPIPCDSLGSLGCAVVLPFPSGPDYVQCVSPPTSPAGASLAAQRFCACLAGGPGVFGTACDDNTDCASGLCFNFVGLAQVCTMPCANAADCPPESPGCTLGVCRVL